MSRSCCVPRVSAKYHSLLYALCSLGLLFGTAGDTRASDPLDWPNWRGPAQDRKSIETGLPARWNPKGGAESNLLWKREDLGSISTPVVLNGKLYTIVRSEAGTSREGEKVVCVDAATGKTIWENKFNVYLSDVPDTRVGWSSCVADPDTGHIYALGVCGMFQCLDGETGETLWSHSLHEEYGLLSTYGGRTNVPVLFDDLVIISAIVIGWGDMAKPAHRFLAFDKNTGELIWFNGTRLLPYDTTYSTPSISMLGGQAALIFGSGDGAVWALQPRTGKPIWKYQFSRRGLNVSPLVIDEKVYAAHGEENIDDTTMGGLVCIDPARDGPEGSAGEIDLTGPGEVWRVKEVMIGKSSPLLVDGTLVVVDDRATLMGFDANTGERKFRKKLGTVMRSTPLYADGKLYLCTANGRWYTLKIDGDRVKTLYKMRLPAGEGSYGSPIVSHGRLYIPTTENLYCVAGQTNTTASVSESPEAIEETAPVDSEASHLQIVPADSLIRPGEKINFRARLFDERGRFLREVPAEFTVDGPGTIDADGVYVAADTSAHQAGVVHGKVGSLTGKARIRLVPDLPWVFDFNDKAVPITWVGARYRHQARDLDGEQAMVKVSTIPKGARSRAWMGHPDMHDYTVEADVRGDVKDNKMPDIGLIAQRYTLDLMGAYQKLQIRSWVPVMRMAKSVDFSWSPDVWYRMKFSVTTEEQDGQMRALLRGKVWPRDQEEPTAWTIEAIDESPNLNGSPGLYGNAKDAELYLDNIRVYPNDS